MSNIILTGFMGCGKTSVGKSLASTLGAAFIDTDVWIEKNYGKVKDIFKNKGEAYFRQLETEAIQSFIDTCDNHVISVGGGLPVTEGNQELLKELGIVVYLSATKKTLIHRLKGDTTRPLLAGEGWEERLDNLLTFRTPIYEAGAHITVSVDYKLISNITEEIIKRLEEMEKGA